MRQKFKIGDKYYFAHYTVSGEFETRSIEWYDTYIDRLRSDKGIAFTDKTECDEICNILNAFQRFVAKYHNEVTLPTTLSEWRSIVTKS